MGKSESLQGWAQQMHDALQLAGKANKAVADAARQSKTAQPVDGTLKQAKGDAATGGVSFKVIDKANGQIIQHAIVAIAGTVGNGGQGRIKKLKPGTNYCNTIADDYRHDMSPVEVTAGKDTPLTISLARLPMGSITYTVLDSASMQPIEKAVIAVAKRKATGSFGIIRVPAGKQQIVVTAPTYEQSSQTIEVRAETDSDVKIVLVSKLKMSMPRPVQDDEKKPARGKGGKPEVSMDGEITTRLVDKPIGPAVVGPAADTLYLLLNEAGSGPIETTTGANLNREGGRVLTEWARLNKIYLSWNNRVALIHGNAKKGADDLKKVEKAKASIAAATRGRAGEYLRGTIRDYVRSVDDVKTKLSDIKTKWNRAKEIFVDMNTATLKQEAAQKAKVVKEKEEKVQDEEKKVEDQKNRIRTAFSIAGDIVNPAKWTSVIAASMVIVGEQAFEANVSTSDLKQAREELKLAKSVLDKAQENAYLSEMAGISLRFSNAREEVNNANLEFSRAANRAMEDEATVVEAMKSSAATAEAAKMVGKHGEIFTAAKEAVEIIGIYLKQSEVYLTQIEAVRVRYAGYVSIAGQTPGNAPYLASLADTARRNENTLAEFKQYIGVIRLQAVDWLKQLSKTKANESYFSGYDQIPDTLRKAVAERNKDTR